ncbi:FkbM family methyltransferase [Methylobacterium pseudosasicola]|uniref:Methyltransferase, FkbM family n=1 Tax=Methylobacterium pseudosasicola TaxID=582667 RepID=A0A1I4I937_9HYPH|nr:FkbM family methyltransferase [Methylobacterium pseudosasicola]SFL50892.1 methyltransferase, FkbM family [Methylobacterium pseudosasicola]
MSFKTLLLSGMAVIGNKLFNSLAVQKILFNAIRLNRREVQHLVSNPDAAFLAYCLARRTRSKSQILQDLWVCFELGEKTNGYFVEFGATNGSKNSNTWLLEKTLGWKGILAEPNPIWHAALAAERSAAIEHRCVSSRSHETVTFLATNDTDPELSGIARHADADHFAETRSRGQRIEIETISLDDLLDAYSAPNCIDYLSIDTEGSELDILSAYSFSRTFNVISVENNPKNEAAIDELLALKGYVRVFRQFSQWDSWYVSGSLRAGLEVVVAAPDA